MPPDNRRGPDRVFRRPRGAQLILVQPDPFDRNALETERPRGSASRVPHDARGDADIRPARHLEHVQAVAGLEVAALPFLAV